MRMNTDFRHTTDQDELIIPTQNGYTVIAAPHLREKTSEERVFHDSQAEPSFKLDPRFYKLGNITQFAFLIVGMVSLMAFIGWQVGGLFGVIVAGALSLSSLLISSNFNVKKILQFKNINPLNVREGYGVYQMVEKLARKANLKSMPLVYLDNREDINAYTLADKENSAIVLSRGLTSHLNQRELYGVLAHEIAHLKNGDIRLMAFADQVSRLTRYLALAGQILLIALVPLILFSQIVVPWALLITLFVAPTLSQLALIAISRNREFKADMEAVAISGDNVGLASALRKIGYQTNIWKRIYAPYIKDVPEILRTHPNTDDRVSRLEQMPLVLENRVA
jgi:heat shock protein HtpX